MDPKLIIALGDGCFSLAQELFSEWILEQLSKETRTKLKDFLQRAIKNYKEALLYPTLDTELRERVKANLQRAQDLLHALGALEEYIDGETITLDKVLKDEKD